MNERCDFGKEKPAPALWTDTLDYDVAVFAPRSGNDDKTIGERKI